MKKNFRKMIVTLLTMAALLCILSFPVAGNEMGTGTGESLVITVVEDIPAEDIEDSAVPLASSAGRANGSGPGLAVAASVIFLCTVIFVIIMTVREKRSAQAAYASAGAIRDTMNNEGSKEKSR